MSAAASYHPPRLGRDCRGVRERPFVPVIGLSPFPLARFGELEAAPALLIPSDEKNSAVTPALGEGMGRFCRSDMFGMLKPRSFNRPEDRLSMFFLKKLPIPDPALVEGGGPLPAPRVFERSIVGRPDGGTAIDDPGLFVGAEDPEPGPPSLLLRLTIVGGIMAAAALPPPENGIVIDVERAPAIALIAVSLLIRPELAKFGVGGRLFVRVVSILVLLELLWTGSGAILPAKPSPPLRSASSSISEFISASWRFERAILRFISSSLRSC
jgi:hypothetical protein